MTESTPTSAPAAGSPGAPDDFAIEAQRILAELTANPNAQFRDGQLESIRDLVQAKKRVLVVQRTKLTLNLLRPNTNIRTHITPTLIL